MAKNTPLTTYHPDTYRDYLQEGQHDDCQAHCSDRCRKSHPHKHSGNRPEHHPACPPEYRAKYGAESLPKNSPTDLPKKSLKNSPDNSLTNVSDATLCKQPHKHSGHISSKELGQQGEEVAVKFLQKKKMRIIARNWRPQGVYQGFELDIIALDGDTLVFVEVKTRRTDADIPIYTAFSRQKQGKVTKAAQMYLHATENWDYPCRFDLVCVCATQAQNFILHHYEHVIEIG